MNDEVMERIKAYAERTGKGEEEAIKEFEQWLSDEFGVTDWQSEDAYLLTEWAEMFVIDTRNLGRSGGGGNRDTIEFVGHILGLNDAPTDLRRRQREEAVSLFKRDSNRAIEQGMIGILKAKEGVWHVNGEPTNERVDGDNLPWFALEVDNTMVTLLNNREGTATFGKPVAPTSEVRYMHFLGNEVNSLIENPRLWRIALSGNSMSAQYEIGQLCQVQVIPPNDPTRDTVYTNRDFCDSIIYIENDDSMSDFTDAARFWVSDKHDTYVDMAELLEAYDDRKIAYNDGFLSPTVITKGYVSRLNKEANDNQYDRTGRNFRLSITSLSAQSKYGRESPLSEITVWIPGTLNDENNPFEFKKGDEWVPYAERTPVLICGQLKTRMFRDDMVPSLTAYGIYVPPRTARPGATGGNTDIAQF